MRSFLLIILTLLSISACVRCKECTLTSTARINDSTTEVSKETADYCGAELKDIEDLGNYQKDNVQYLWTCLEN